MGRIESLKLRVLVIILNLLAVSLVFAESDSAIVAPSYYGGLTFRLVEDRIQDRHPIPADKKVQVDLRSTLFLLFKPPQASGESEEPSAEWEVVQDLLNDVNRLAKQYVELNSESVDISDPNAVKNLQERVSKHDEMTDEALEKASALAMNAGWSDEEYWDIILTGKIARPGYKPGEGFPNLVNFLKEQIEDLQAEARQFRQDKDGYELTVIALHKQAGGGTSRIHVDEYDNLPSGDPEAPRPLEQYGIRMTPKELRRFRMEVKASQDAADMIREIMENRDEIRSGVKRLRNQLKAQLENLIEQFGEDSLWKQALKNCMDQLTILKDNPDTPDKVKNASVALRTTLEGIQGDIDTIRSIVEQAKELRNDLVRNRTTDLLEVITIGSTTLNSLNKLIGKMDDLQILKKTPNDFAEIKKNAIVVAEHLTEEAAKKEIEEIATYLDNLPKTATFLRFVSEYMTSPVNQIVDAGDTLEDVADPIYYDIKDPPTAAIDLDQYRDLERKDVIIVKVMFRAKENEGLKGIEHIESYYLELEKLDVYTSVSASLIFARALTGTEEATQWAPNVAAMVNWHYRNREPIDGRKLNKRDEVWNWLDPGGGVHLASLDQGDDTVEFGVGVNLSLWNGLLNTGYGYNLSLPEDRDYFFVGLNLLHLLDVARGTASTPSWERRID